MSAVVLLTLTGDPAVLESLKPGGSTQPALLGYARGTVSRAAALEAARWAGGAERMRGWIGMIDEHRKAGSGRADLAAVAKRFGRVHWIAIWAAKVIER